MTKVARLPAKRVQHDDGDRPARPGWPGVQEFFDEALKDDIEDQDHVSRSVAS